MQKILLKLFTVEQWVRWQNYKRELKRTFITPLLGFLVIFLELISLLDWLLRIKPKSDKDRQYLNVEKLVFISLVVETIAFVLVGHYLKHPALLLWPILITLALGFRMLNIILAWIHNFLMKSGGIKLYPTRTLILPIINYIEMIIGFSILGFVWNLEFQEKFAGLQDSTIFTIGTMTAIGSKFEPNSFFAWTLYICEISIGLFFLIVIVVRALSYFEEKKE